MATQTITSSKNVKTPTRKHGCLFWITRIILGVIIAVVALIASGIFYESASAAGDAERFPAAGQMVTVDTSTNRSMHINCAGDGEITVVLEAGFGAWSDMWSLVQPQVADFTRVCSYDRAGMGWSDPAATTQTQEQIARDLHALLTEANVQPPYVLVGHSIGGKSVRLFASLYPEEVSGLVFVDARHESMEPTDRTPEQNQLDREIYESSLGLQRTLRQLGVARLFGLQLGRSFDPSLNAYPDDVAYRMVMFGVDETTLQAMIAESRGGTTSDDQLRASSLPQDLPIFVLTADATLLELDGWENAQAQLAALSSNSVSQVIPNSTHNLHAVQPAAVTDAIRRVWEAAVSGLPLAEDVAS